MSTRHGSVQRAIIAHLQVHEHCRVDDRLKYAVLGRPGMTDADHSDAGNGPWRITPASDTRALQESIRRALRKLAKEGLIVAEPSARGRLGLPGAAAHRWGITEKFRLVYGHASRAHLKDDVP
jgi:hypothetical protein